MGVRRVDERTWLFTDEHRDEQLGLKRRLLRDRPDDVLVVWPEGEPAWTELERMLVQFWPYRAQTAPTFASTVQEDVCVLTRDGDGRFVLTAACVCFPSHWRLADKMGRPVTEIHGPVPRYEVELAAKVDTFLARLRPGAVFARRNWTIHESPDLFAPEPPAAANLDLPPDELWLRSERQTLRRLLATDAIVFTIHTQQIPIAALRRRPDVAARLARRLAAEPHDRVYAPHVPALVRRLRS